ncbi:MAG: AAA-like domain-containing protein [Oscillospiraceae bacterium]|nr:AAA-like domain-containing protein [Oscillospiraceae bacterium]
MPEKHYMVDISEKLTKIKAMVDYGDYFTINRARQYGKTTTLSLLRTTLKDEYVVASISFEGLGDKTFASASNFCETFMKLIQRALEFADVSAEYRERWYNSDVDDFDALGFHITEMCKDKKFVLMIDEVDKTSDNRTYLHFLGMLRDKYLKREQNMDITFHSVILAGVYDIKNIKLKMITEGAITTEATENRLYNSPWNIAADFDVDLSFSSAEIATMLAQYDADKASNMDISLIADELYRVTSGYPYLVSRICKHIDEKLEKNWTLAGIQEAVQFVLFEKSTLFDDMTKNLENNKNLYDFIYNLLFIGKEYEYNTDDPVIELGSMYGFIKSGDRRRAKVTNTIFETRMYNYFVSKNATSSKRITGVLQNDVLNGGRFDMELCLKKFAAHYSEIFSERDADFIEREGRLLFLSYLKPLINGQGFYHIESQFTDLRRMDIVVDFGSNQFILELKLWKGESEHSKAYDQLWGYLDHKGTDTGYLLTFDFRKGESKTPIAQWVEWNGKQIFDVMV